jgi:hypothetical protein
VTEEHVLRSAYARVGFEGDAAEHAEHPGAANPADGIPGQVRGERREHGETNRRREAQAPGRGQAARRDQHRRRRNRHAELVREDVEEQQELAVSDDCRQKRIHVRGSCIIHRIAAKPVIARSPWCPRL